MSNESKTFTIGSPDTALLGRTTSRIAEQRVQDWLELRRRVRNHSQDSLVAVCCSNASVRSGPSVQFFGPRVFHRDHGLIGKGL